MPNVSSSQRPLKEKLLSPRSRQRNRWSGSSRDLPEFRGRGKLGDARALTQTTRLSSLHLPACALGTPGPAHCLLPLSTMGSGPHDFRRLGRRHCPAGTRPPGATLGSLDTHTLQADEPDLEQSNTEMSPPCRFTGRRDGQGGISSQVSFLPTLLAEITSF